MTNRRPLLIVLVLMAASGCRDRHEDEGRAESQATPQAKVVEAPYLTDEKGVNFPYFRYERDVHPFAASHEYGMAMFVHPIFEVRNKGLALDYLPTDEMKDLFGEELFGREFFVGSKDGILAVDGLPISRPLDAGQTTKWKMIHDGQAFECGVERRSGENFMVGCVSPEIRLTLVFNEDRGLTSFQDPCSEGLCTYHLKTGVGLLSPAHLRVMKL